MQKKKKSQHRLSYKWAWCWDHESDWLIFLIRISFIQNLFFLFLFFFFPFCETKNNISWETESHVYLSFTVPTPVTAWTVISTLSVWRKALIYLLASLWLEYQVGVKALTELWIRDSFCLNQLCFVQVGMCQWKLSRTQALFIVYVQHVKEDCGTKSLAAVLYCGDYIFILRYGQPRSWDGFVFLLLACVLIGQSGNHILWYQLDKIATENCFVAGT